MLQQRLSSRSFPMLHYYNFSYLVTLNDNYNRCRRVVTSRSSYICIRIYQARKSTDELRKLRYINFCTPSFAAFSGFIADEFERRKFHGREEMGRARCVSAKKNNAIPQRDGDDDGDVEPRWRRRQAKSRLGVWIFCN